MQELSDSLEDLELPCPGCKELVSVLHWCDACGVCLSCCECEELPDGDLSDMEDQRYYWERF